MTVAELSKRGKKRFAVETHNALFDARPYDPRPGMRKYRAILWQLWRLEHDRKALLEKEPRDILKSQLVYFRPVAPEPIEDAATEDARDMAATIAAEGDESDPEDEAAEEREVRSTAKRFAFHYHQKCRGRGYVVKSGRAKICKCAARKMAAYIEAESRES